MQTSFSVASPVYMNMYYNKAAYIVFPSICDETHTHNTRL